MQVAEPKSDAVSGPGPDEKVLEVSDLHVEFRTTGGLVRAVNGISYSVSPGKTLAILGESGSGKTVSSQALMGLLDSPPAFITKGQALYRGRDLLKLKERDLRAIRGHKIAMIFQDALSSLNPVYPVGDQIAEMYRIHLDIPRSEANRRALEVLDRVRIPSAKDRFKQYPHQFSGGMRQRAMIAVAIALNPEVLIADEPTTALDVTVQAQIMNLLKTLQDETGMALVLITHDLGVVAETADDVVVMYAGKVVEAGPISAVFTKPAHPYTLGLMRSIPNAHRRTAELTAIGGTPPNLARIPVGCPFHPRCRFRRERCWNEEPPEYDVSPGRTSACHFYEEILGES